MTCRTGRSTSPAGVCGQGGVVVGRGVTWMPAEGEHDLTPAAPEPGRRCRPKVSRWRKGITASRASAGQAPECPETPRSPQGLAARDGLVERDMFAARASSPQRAPIPQHMRTDIGLICEAALGVDLDMLGRPTGEGAPTIVGWPTCRRHTAGCPVPMENSAIHAAAVAWDVGLGSLTGVELPKTSLRADAMRRGPAQSRIRHAVPACILEKSAVQPSSSGSALAGKGRVVVTEPGALGHLPVSNGTRAMAFALCRGIGATCPVIAAGLLPARRPSF